jgi:hypothetical protein
MRRNNSKGILAKAAILLLLVAVAGLSTLAKHSQYLPKSNPTHFFSNAAKMDVAHLPVIFLPAPAYPVAKIAPPEPAFRMLLQIFPEKIELPQIGLTVSLQHRSPPSSRA